MIDAHLARDGKLSYMQIPADDVEVSAAFYAATFGWSLGGSPAHRSFADASGELIGAFITGRAISREAGILPYVYVDGLNAALERVVSNGGEIVAPASSEGDLRVATARDPAGNLIGLWQAGGR
ncbi:MAG TPA: VOC family protein [Phenylobacterium sp.]